MEQFKKAEEQPNPYLEIREQCTYEVRRGFENLVGHILDGDDREEQYDNEINHDLVTDMAMEAARLGDYDVVSNAIGFLKNYTDSDEAEIAASCYSLASMGSTYAYDALSQLLAAEKAKTKANIESGKKQFQSIFNHYHMTVGLGEVIRGCEKAEMIPNAWIDKYAINEEHRQYLYLYHHYRMTSGISAQSEQHQEKLEEHFREILTNPSISPEFRHSETINMFSAVKDPDLLDLTLKVYKDNLRYIMPSDYVYMQHISLGCRVIGNPATATEQNIEYFEKSISYLGEYIRTNGGNDFTLSQSQLPWKIALLRKKGASATEIIDYLDLQIGALLTHDMPEETNADCIYSPRDRQYLIINRDIILAQEAEFSLNRGDFPGAREFLLSIGNEIDQELTFEKCIKKASSLDELQYFKPDEFTMQLKPGFAMQYRIAEGLLNNDIDKLEELTMDLAGNMGCLNRNLGPKNLEYVFNAVSRFKGRRATAEKILKILRENKAKRKVTKKYSDILIAEGDADEPQRAFEEIDARSENESARLHDFWKLTLMLRDIPNAE